MLVLPPLNIPQRNLHSTKTKPLLTFTLMSGKTLYDQIAEIHGDDVASDVYNRLLKGEPVQKEIERLLSPDKK